MGAIQYPEINGVEASHASLEVGVDGLYIPAIRSLNFKSTHEVGRVRGTSAHPISRTRGIEDSEGSLELSLKWWKRLLEKITVNGEYAARSWPVKCVYWERASPADMFKVFLPGVRFLSPEYSSSEGPEPVMVTVTLDIMGPIEVNDVVGLRVAR